MATTTRKPAARPARKKATPAPARKAAPSAKAASPAKATSAAGDGAALRSVQQVIDDLDRMRDQASDDLRRQLDTAVNRMRDVAGDLRERTDERTQSIEQALTRVADDAWLQLATLSVHGIRDADTLTELSGEIRKRRSQLRPAAKRAAARKAG